MRKFGIEAPEPRRTFSHARTKPLVVEKTRRRTTLRCPSCGAQMRLVRKANELTAVCSQCERK